MVPPAALAAPVTYNFTTAGGPAAVGDLTNPAVASALAALGLNPVISGSFVYDPASPLTGTGTGGVAIYGNAAAIAPSFSALVGTVAGHGFSDPKGFVTVGHNAPFGAIASTDSIEYYADSPLTSSVVHNFNSFALGTASVVNIRMFWFQGLPGISSGFLSDQSMPAAPPTLIGRLALDLDTSTNPALTSTSWVFFDGLTVMAAPVPEPGTYALLLAGLGMMVLVARRRRIG